MYSFCPIMCIYDCWFELQILKFECCIELYIGVSVKPVRDTRGIWDPLTFTISQLFCGPVSNLSDPPAAFPLIIRHSLLGTRSRNASQPCLCRAQQWKIARCAGLQRVAKSVSNVRASSHRFGGTCGRKTGLGLRHQGLSDTGLHVVQVRS
jgi:hypothetical protein